MARKAKQGAADWQSADCDAQYPRLRIIGWTKSCKLADSEAVHAGVKQIVFFLVGINPPRLTPR
jgi:hypothetical protein